MGRFTLLFCSLKPIVQEFPVFSGPGWAGGGKGPEDSALGDPRNPLMNFSSVLSPGLGSGDPNLAPVQTHDGQPRLSVLSASKH